MVVGASHYQCHAYAKAPRTNAVPFRPLPVLPWYSTWLRIIYAYLRAMTIEIMTYLDQKGGPSKQTVNSVLSLYIINDEPSAPERISRTRN